MRGLIIYKSKYGSTEEYASWISEETGFSKKSIKEVSKDDINNAEIIIIGSPVMAGKYIIAGWLKKHWHELKDKAVAFYSVCATDLKDTEQIEKFWVASFSDDIRKAMRFFMFGGRKEFDKLSPVIKFMLKTVSKMEKDPKVKKELLMDVNNMNSDFIKPLIEYIDSLKS
ncbi:MAG: flavodoxin domain-containing protein [Bacteroidales bacterium]|nr:flavodoxin domain-containing protein [Bacteroidales bacterium]